MKWAGRFSIMVIVGGGSLWALKRLGLLNIGPLEQAFHQGWLWIGLSAISLLGLLLVSAVRFFSLTRLMGFCAPFRDVLAANLVGQALGQWLPGSMAWVEVVRFGMMAGWPIDEARIADTSTAGAKGRLGLTLLVDRVLGLGAMFAIGGLAGYLACARSDVGRKDTAVVLLLSTLSFITGFVVVAIPLKPRFFLRRMGSRAARQESGAAREGILTSISCQVRRLLETLVQARISRVRTVELVLMSAAAAALNSLTLYFASQAGGRPVPYSIVLGAVPFTIASIFVPSGIAGFGGPQLLAAGVFRLFGADPQTVVSACLLQNTIVLIVQTVCGGLGVILPTKHFIFHRRRFP